MGTIQPDLAQEIRYLPRGFDTSYDGREVITCLRVVYVYLKIRELPMHGASVFLPFVMVSQGKHLDLIEAFLDTGSEHIETQRHRCRVIASFSQRAYYLCRNAEHIGKLWHDSHYELAR
jgi:hypothetical protein